MLLAMKTRYFYWCVSNGLLSFIVSQIVSCPVVLSWLVLLDSVNKSFVRRCMVTVDYDSVAFVLS